MDPRIEKKTAKISEDFELAYLTAGEGPLVVLCHGWPEISYTWRKQILPIADAGYKVVAPDLPGFGQSTAPKDVEAYSLKEVANVLARFLDVLEVPKAIFIGHDWGSSTVYRVALHHPEKVIAIATLCVPFLFSKEYRSLEELATAIPSLKYQLYFSQGDMAEKEFNQNIERVFRSLLRSSKPEDQPAPPANKGMGFLDNFGNPERSSMITQEELDYYVSQFTPRGFGPSFNYYRNNKKNWEDDSKTSLQIPHPSLFIFAEKDRALKDVPSQHMIHFVPNMKRVNFPECGHWVTSEQPELLNETLLGWLKEIKA